MSQKNVPLRNLKRFVTNTKKIPRFIFRFSFFINFAKSRNKTVLTLLNSQLPMKHSV